MHMVQIPGAKLIQGDYWVFMSDGGDWLRCPKKRVEEIPKCRVSEIHWHAWVQSPEAVSSCQLRSGILSFHAFRWSGPSTCSLCAIDYMLPTESVSVWYWFQEINCASFSNSSFSAQALLHVLASLPFPCEAKVKSHCCLYIERNPEAERTAVYLKYFQ